MSDSSRQMGEGEDLHNQRTIFAPMQAEQAESDRTRFDPQNNAAQGRHNPSENHGSLEPEDSRNVTGASGSAGVGAPGGSDRQSGGERWGGGQQGQTQTPDAAGQQQAAEDVEFTPDPGLEPAGEEVEFEPDQSPSQQSQSMAGQQQAGGGAFAGANAAFDQQSQGGAPAGQFGENLGADQMSQFDSAAGGQMGGDSEAGSRFASRIREHMVVIGADGVRLGTVDAVDGGRIKLTKADSGMGSHQGHHHYIGCGLVADIEGDTVRLSPTAANAWAMLEEE